MMRGNINYQKILESTIEEISAMQQPPTLLLHSCCAPCSSYVLEYLTGYFQIKLLYYNPNIYPPAEYENRAGEQERFIKCIPHKNNIEFIADVYNPGEFYDIAKGYEKDPEGSLRCFRCYELRLKRAARLAKELGCDYFTTTLSISPLKNAFKINEIGLKLEEEYKVRYLLADFKKKNGYQRSIELSKRYNLYRQDYCGCIYSKIQRLRNS